MDYRLMNSKRFYELKINLKKRALEEVMGDGSTLIGS